MRGTIRKMYDNGATEEIMTPIAHITHAMEHSSDDEDYSSDESRSSDEWYGKEKVNTAHVPIEPEPPSPSHDISINTIEPEPPPLHSVYDPPNQEET